MPSAQIAVLAPAGSRSLAGSRAAAGSTQGAWHTSNTRKWGGTPTEQNNSADLSKVTGDKVPSG